MRIISWNVNGLNARQDSVRKLASDYKPDILCLQKIRTAGLMTIPGYFGWMGTLNIGQGLFGGVSSFINLETTGFDFNSQRNDMPEWLSETGSINVLRFPQFILVNAYFPYSNVSDENLIKIRQRWDYELHEYLVRLARHHI